MAGIDDTKARLLRGLVQENLGAPPKRRSKQPKPGRQRWTWVLSALVVSAVISVILPSFVISPGNAPPAAAIPHPEATASEPERVPEFEAPLPQPRPIDRAAIPLAIKTIVIDAGHGGEPGTTAESGITEKEITLDIALRIRRLLEHAPYNVLLTRETDRAVSLDRRVRFANESKADLFLSIHVNWMEPHSIRALETYYVGPTDDPATLKLASRENKGSGYSMSDYKKILEKIYIDARRDESRSLARTVQSRLFSALKAANPQLENRGIKTAPFAVLIGTQMPAILVEVACISNEEEAELLTKDSYRETIAMALAAGIRNYANPPETVARKGT
jgi:N-acetylmuramoyl-L-alanine amidase